MVKENEYILSRVNIAMDWLIAACALLCAHVLRNYLLAPYIVPEIFRYRSAFHDYWWLAFFLPTMTVILLGYYGHYRSIRTRGWSSLAAAHLFATIGATLAAALVSFAFTPRGGRTGLSSLFTEEFVSRGVLVLFVPVATVSLQLKEAALRVFLRRLRGRGFNVQNLLLVGSQTAATEFLEFLEQHPQWGFQVVGVVSDGGGSPGGPAGEIVGEGLREAGAQGRGVPVVGEYDDLLTYVQNHVVDDVVFLPADDGLRRLQPLLRGCEEMGLRTRIPLDYPGYNIARASLEMFDQLPVVTFNPVKEFGAALLFKYASDRVLAALLLVVLLPVFIVIFALIKLNSASRRHPVFYGQTRCGLHGRQFCLWKFRSMIVGADGQRDHLEQHNEMSGPVFKMRNDPRITAVGKWLRWSSLDELPQLWNVVRGEMSLVGPRPPLPEEVQHYDRWQRRRLSMKPGMTCIWQVSGRNRLSFEEWMAMDLQYIDNWSLGLDAKILMKTIYVVATGYGAM